MNKAACVFLMLLLVSVLAASCSTVKDGAVSTYEFVFDSEPTATPVFPKKDDVLVDAAFDAADEMHSNVNRTLLPADSPVYITRFVNIENTADRSPFGKVVSEQIAVRLFQRGWRIADGAPPEDAVSKFDKQAEEHEDKDLILRETDYNIQPSMLVGSYEVGDESVLVHARVVRLRDKLVVAAHAWSLPMNDRVRDLLGLTEPADSMRPTVRTEF